MKNLKIFAFAVLLFIAERVIFTKFQIFSFTPWLLFAFCASSATQHEELGWWIFTAGLCGLAEDLAGGGAAGVGMTVYASAAVGINLLSTRVFHENIPLDALIIFVFSIAAHMMYCLMNYGMAQGSIAAVLWRTALPLAVINTAFSMLFYPLARKAVNERRRAV